MLILTLALTLTLTLTLTLALTLTLTLTLTLSLTGHLPHRSSSVQASGHATARNSSKHFSHCRLKTSLHFRIKKGFYLHCHLTLEIEKHLKTS
jgi:hypothetical protein